jgi:hypothetical protein
MTLGELPNRIGVVCLGEFESLKEEIRDVLDMMEKGKRCFFLKWVWMEQYGLKRTPLREAKLKKDESKWSSTQKRTEDL